MTKPSIREFEQSCLRTWNHTLSDRERLQNAALGLAGEVGEVIELVKKESFHGKEYVDADYLNEIGDVLYYLNILLAEKGLDIPSAMAYNKKKLEERYPEGFKKQ